MDRTVIGALFVVLTLAVVVWRVLQRGRDIAGAPDRAPVAPESPALAISSGAGDVGEAGLRGDGSTDERGSGGAARGVDGEPL